MSLAVEPFVLARRRPTDVAPTQWYIRVEIGKYLPAVGDGACDQARAALAGRQIARALRRSAWYADHELQFAEIRDSELHMLAESLTGTTSAARLHDLLDELYVLAEVEHIWLA